LPEWQLVAAISKIALVRVEVFVIARGGYSERKARDAAFRGAMRK
jgi:hypothetical protein